MEDDRRRGGWIEERLLKKWIVWSMTHPVGVIVAIAGVTVILAVPVGWIKLDPDLGALLPEDADSTVRLRQATRRIGGTDLFAVTAEGDDSKANRDAIDYMAGKISGWKECIWTVSGWEFGNLKQKSLLLLEEDTLNKLTSAVSERIDYEFCRINPLCFNLEEKGRGEFIKPVLEEIKNKPVIDGWQDFKYEKFLDITKGQEELQKVKRLESPDGRVSALLARLIKPATDIDFARHVRQKLKRIIDEMDPALRDKVSINLRGAYDATREYDIIRREAAFVSIFSFFLMCFMAILFFRQKRVVVVILFPVITGSIWSLCLAYLLYGKLNSITAFIVAILLGMGVDYSVHIQRRFNEERACGYGAIEAMFRGIRTIFHPLVVALTTTVGALLVLRIAHFQGFKEYGTIASCGVLFCYLASILSIPALNGLSMRFKKVDLKVIGEEKAESSGRMKSIVFLKRRSGNAKLFGVGAYIFTVIVASFVIFPYAKKINFETDFKRFRAPGVGRIKELEEAIGVGRANPLIILGESEVQMRRIHKWLKQKYESQFQKGRKKLIAGFLTISSVLPEKEVQLRRLKIIKKLSRLLNKKLLDNVKGDAGQMIKKLRELSAVESPIEFDDLPILLGSLLEEKSGLKGAIGYIYPAVDRWNGKEVLSLRNEYDLINDVEGKVEIASSSFVFLDVVSVVKSDLKRVGIFASIIIFLVLLVDLKSLLGAMLCFGTLFISVIWTLFLMKITGVNIGPFNLLVLPTLLGVGIDSSVYMWHRWKNIGERSIDYLLTSTGVTVLIALLTTAAGFSGLLFSLHPGLTSIAYFAIPGIVLIIFFNLTFLPAVLLFVKGKRMRD